MPRPTSLRSKLALVMGVLALAAAALMPSAAVADDGSEIPTPESGDYLGSTTLDEADPGEASATAGTQAISLKGFSAGNLISDKLMYTSGTMTTAQIQAFLNAKVPSCQKGYTCLKNFTQKTSTKASNTYCSGTYAGSAKESAASIISKAAKACGISEKVLLVILQKEQGLVTHTWPSDFRYDKAMGFACPDNAACDPQFLGFQNQVYMAAKQLRRYSMDPSFNWYPVGKTSQVRYHPNAACGTSSVKIENKATAALYYYTPYQPNRAALSAGYGTGDSCSSYGNRNFVNYYTDWFGESGSGGGAKGPNPKDAKPVARFWSSTFDNAHFYTLNAAYEGTGFRAWATTNGACRAGTIPVYRFWSSKFESHFYTTNSTEMKTVRDTDKNWTYEGAAFCTAATSSSSTTPVYRFWSDKFGKHFYTSNAAESQNLQKNDKNWTYEGVALYAPK
jgi:hypothetical protein